MWTREAVEALGPTTDVPTVASIFDVHADTVYAQIRRGEWTATRVLTLGRKIKIPTRDIIALLYSPESAADSPHDGGEQQCESGPQTRSSDAVKSHHECGCRVGDVAVIRPLRGA